MKEEEKYKKKEPQVGTYTPKKEEKKPEKKPPVQKTVKKQLGTVICVKAGALVLNVKGNGVSIPKTAKHKDVQAGDKIEF